MKRYLFVLLAVLLTVTLFSACGSSASGSGNNSIFDTAFNNSVNNTVDQADEEEVADFAYSKFGGKYVITFLDAGSVRSTISIEYGSDFYNQFLQRIGATDETVEEKVLTIIIKEDGSCVIHECLDFTTPQTHYGSWKALDEETYRVVLDGGDEIILTSTFQSNGTTLIGKYKSRAFTVYNGK